MAGDFTFIPNPNFMEEANDLSEEKIVEGLDNAVPIAQDLSPRDTGANAASIQRDELSIITTSGYGGWLEIGSQGRPARPYILPAVQQAFKELD